MFKNYLVTAWRNIINHKLHAAINIGGLSLSLLAAVMILLFVNDEVSFDKKWADSNRIYRLENQLNTRSQGPMKFATSLGGLKYGMEEEFSEIEELGRLFIIDENARQGADLFSENVGYIDPSFLNIFNFEFLEGNLKTALLDNQSVILTRSSREKYFGNENALGEIIALNSNFFGEISYKVSAVIEDLPLNSHLAFDSLALFDSNRANNFTGFEQQWNSAAAYTYIKFRKGIDTQSFTESLPGFIDQVVVLPERMRAFFNRPSEYITSTIRPIGEIHLYSNQIAEIKPPGSISTVYIFLIVAFLLIFIAAVNFINLTTAQASLRAKEIGLRKVMGAKRKQLRLQFLSETTLFVFLGLFISIGAAQLLLPWYNEFLLKDLTLGQIFTPLGFLGVIVSGAVLGALSGFYPAFFLSSLNPSTIVKSGRSAETSRTVLLRKVLVVGQFSIAVALIIISGVIYFQMNHLRNFDPGFNASNISVINLPGTQSTQDLENLKARIENIPGVRSAGLSAFAPGTFNALSSSGFTKPGDDQRYGASFASVGPGFFETLEINLLAGRFLSREFALDLQPPQNDPEDSQAYSIIINESMVSSLGFQNPEDAIGTTLLTTPGVGFAANALQIVGVIPDIQFLNAFSENRPTFYYYQPNSNARGFIGTLLVKTESNREENIESVMRTAWDQMFPNNLFLVDDLSQQIETVYINEQKQGVSFRYFMLLAIALSALGLYGLAAFTADSRTKEIGIRKALGASISDILGLLLWQFSKPVVVANFIAWPVAWYFAQDWLANFTQRIDISVLLFFGASALAILIAWVTVIGHAYRVARTNPVHVLRHE